VTQGGVSVTPLEFDRTAISLREQLRTALQSI
jgi:5'-nucleotidase